MQQARLLYDRLTAAAKRVTGAGLGRAIGRGERYGRLLLAEFRALDEGGSLNGDGGAQATDSGVGGKLLQTVESSNPIESMIEIIRDHAGRVKRWSSGEMALRWAAAGMLAAQGQFRRVKGYQELPQLALALERTTAEEPGLLDLPSAVSA